MKKICLTGFTCLVFLTTLLHAQSNYVPGVITKSDGTYLSGLINFQEWDVSPSKIEFKLTDTSEKQTFTPSEIKAFDVTGIEQYVSATVDLNIAPIKLEELTTNREPVFKNTTIFLRTIVNSHASLYFHIDKFGKEHFFFNVGDSSIEELIYTMYHERLYEKEIGVFHRFRRQLIKGLAACRSVKGLIDVANYDRESLQPIIESYNTCIDEEIAFAEKEDRSILKIGIVGGGGVTRLNFRGIENFDLGETKFSPQPTYYAGLFLSVLASRNLNRFSIENELVYHAIGGKGHFEDIESDANYTIRDSEIQFSYIQYNHLWRYTRASRMKPFINGGLSTGILLSQNKNIAITDSKFFSVPTSSEMPVLAEATPIDFGGILGLGFSWSHLTVEVRTEIGKRLNDITSGPKERTIALFLRYQL